MTISDTALLNVLKMLQESDNVAIDIESGQLRLSARKGKAAEITKSLSSSKTEKPSESVIRSSPKEVLEKVSPLSLATGNDEELKDEDLAAAEAEGLVILRSPMKGTFYRAPAPGEPPFCKEGDVVGPNDTVCLIEIMKLFNSIPAGVSGKVEEFYVDNAGSVDLGQPIAAIRPD